MSKPFIIAEIAQGYEGQERLVDFYLKAASFSGADAIKFQIFFADELALKDYKHYSLFKSLELPFAVWKKAVSTAHESGLEFYSDVFGLDSFQKLDEIGTDGYKIHSTDINNFPLLKRVARTKKKIFLSTGGCEQSEIREALKVLDSSRVTLMYGFQAEPTAIKDNHLNRIKTLKSVFNMPVGFQDHTLGESPLALQAPLVALGLGVELIEKHLTLSRAAEIEDYISALEPHEFKRWASEIKEMYPILGMEEWRLTENETAYRTKVKRAVCSRKPLRKGTVLGLEDIALKRTDAKNALYGLSEVIGKTVKRTVPANAVIEKRFLR